MNRSTGSVARCAVLAILLGVGATFGVAPAARADDASVKQAIEFQDAHALKLSPQLKAALNVRHPTGAERRTVIRLSRMFATTADGAAAAVNKTTASTAKGRQGKTAWVQSVRDLAQVFRANATQLQDLASGDTAGAKQARATALKDQMALDRLDRQAQRDLGLPKGD
jgi:hypothetical protein